MVLMSDGEQDIGQWGPDGVLFHHRSQEEPYQARWRRVRRSLSLDGPGFADDLACRYVALERLE